MAKLVITKATFGRFYARRGQARYTMLATTNDDPTSSPAPYRITFEAMPRRGGFVFAGTAYVQDHKIVSVVAERWTHGRLASLAGEFLDAVRAYAAARKQEVAK